MALARPARSLFQVQTGEAGLVALMILYSAAAAGGVWTIGFNGVGQALFLSRLPASDVPFTFILPAIAIVVVLAGYSRLASQVALAPLAAATSALLLILAIVFRVLLGSGLGGSFGLLAGIYLYCEAAGSLVLVQFWTFAGQIFNARQARRLFGLIAAGGTLSSAVAGVVLVVLTKAIGVDNLILIVGGSSGVCGVCALLLRKDVPARPPSMERTADTDARATLVAGLHDVWRTPLLRSIGLITVLVSLLINIGAYQFFLVLQSAYAGRSAALAGFLGAFAIWTGVAALVMQVLGTGPVMVRFGALAAQAIFPLAMATGAGALLLVWGTLWAVTLTRAFDPALRRTFHDASVNALYLPLPAEQRQRARAVLEGVYAVSFGLAGLAFLLVQRSLPSWTYQYWSVPVLVLSACWVALLVAARRQYVAALARGIDTRRLSFDDPRLDLTDEISRRVLVRALNNPDERVVVHVLDLIAAAAGTAWLPQVVPLLGHRSPHVRVTALRCLERAGDAAYADAAAGLLAATEDEVSSIAISALDGLLGSNAVELVAPLLADPRPQTAGAAVTVLLCHGDAIQRRAAAKRLHEMLAGELPAVRRAAARALGALAGAALGSLSPADRLATLAPLIDFADPEFQLDCGWPAASPGDCLSPAGRLVIVCLIRLLRDKQTREVAADSLALHGVAAVPALARVLGGSLSPDGRRPAIRTQAHEASAVRMQAAAILQRLGGSDAAGALLEACSDLDLTVRDAAARSFADLCLRERPSGIDGSQLAALIMEEIAGCYRLRLWIEELRPAGEDGLLIAALFERMRRGLDRVLFLLQAQYPEHELARAHAAATASTGAGRASRTQAMAAEMLDSVIDRRVTGLLLPLLEAPGERVAGIAVRELGMARKSASERITVLAGGDDPWLRACAVFTIGLAPEPQHESCWPGLTPLVVEALNAGDDLVRETALAACRRILDPGRVAEVAAEQAHQASLPLTRRYALSLLAEAGQPDSSLGAV